LGLDKQTNPTCPQSIAPTKLSDSSSRRSTATDNASDAFEWLAIAIVKLADAFASLAIAIVSRSASWAHRQPLLAQARFAQWARKMSVRPVGCETMGVHMARLLGIRIKNYRALADFRLGQVEYGKGEPT
jgi:hypothetical protein